MALAQIQITLTVEYSGRYDTVGELVEDVDVTLPNIVISASDRDCEVVAKEIYFAGNLPHNCPKSYQGVGDEICWQCRIKKKCPFKDR